MRLTVIIVIILVLFPTAVAQAYTINIPADYPTIQEGIDAAENGDTVLVAPGTYVENIDFIGKAITVKSSDGVENTAIDGGNPSNFDYGSVVLFKANEGEDSILEGFTLLNGTGTMDSKNSRGGGIFCDNFTSPTIRNNIIKECSAEIGGGLLCDPDSGPTVTGCKFSNNMAVYDGGGICCYLTTADISGNTISGNSANDGAGVYLLSVYSFKYNDIRGNTAYNEGGGIYMSSDLVDGNQITDNKAQCGGGIYCLSDGAVMNNTILRNESFFGGGIYFEGSAMKAANNIVAENQAERGGGFFFSWYYSSSISKLVNNVFTHNSATKGGGLYCEIGQYNCPLDVSNSIFWENDLHEIYLEWQLGSAAMNISYCDVKGGIGSIHVGENFTLNWGSGMIDADPLFVDPDNNDYHLTYTSPCRDSGDNSAVTELYDFEGDPRIAWDGTVDMGADEFYTHQYVTGDQTPGGDMQGKFVGLPGASPVGLFIGSSIRPTPISTAYGDFWLLPPRILIPLIPIPANGILTIPTTIPLSPPAPYDIPMQGLVGLNSNSLTNLCVLEVR